MGTAGLGTERSWGCQSSGPYFRQLPASIQCASDPVFPPPMTAKSNFETLVTVFGGSGFVGRHVVRALANRGYRIRVAVRRPDLAGFLRPMGRVGQVSPVQANLRFPHSVTAAVRDADIVVNLVGVLYERGSQSFDAVQAA